MVAFIISNIAGLIRQILIANAFGTKADMEAFNAANRVAETLFSLVAGGALASAFIPIFTSLLAKEDRERAWRLASAIANLVFLVTVISGFGCGNIRSLGGEAYSRARLCQRSSERESNHRPDALDAAISGDLRSQWVGDGDIKLQPNLLLSISGARYVPDRDDFRSDIPGPENGDLWLGLGGNNRRWFTSPAANSCVIEVAWKIFIHLRAGYARCGRSDPIDGTTLIRGCSCAVELLDKRTPGFAFY